jgi:hypothetical protein
VLMLPDEADTKLIDDDGVITRTKEHIEPYRKSFD